MCHLQYLRINRKYLNVFMTTKKLMTKKLMNNLEILTQGRNILKTKVTKKKKEGYINKYTTIYLAMDADQKKEQFIKISAIFINDFMKSTKPINDATIKIFWLLLYNNYLKIAKAGNVQTMDTEDINNEVDAKPKIEGLLRELYTWGDFYGGHQRDNLQQLVGSYIGFLKPKKNKKLMKLFIKNEVFYEKLTPGNLASPSELKNKCVEQNKDLWGTRGATRRNIENFIFSLIKENIKENKKNLNTKCIDEKRKDLNGVQALEFFKIFKQKILKSPDLISPKFRKIMADECRYLASILGTRFDGPARLRALALNESSSYHQYVAVEF